MNADKKRRLQRGSVSKMQRRWYQHSMWSLVVPENAEQRSFSWWRLLPACLLFGLAVAAFAFASCQLEPHAVAWFFAASGTGFVLAGAGIGVLRAGRRGALGGALTALSLFVVAIGLLFLFAIVSAVH